MAEHAYSMTEASKLLEERTSVLRYWEEELALTIARNERGCRYYTRQDVQVLLCIKELKKKGYMLREIRKLITLLYGRDEKAAAKATEKREEKTLDRAREKTAKIYGKNDLKEVERRDVFFKVLEKAMAEMRRQNRREERYKRVDEAIRQHQLARRQVAAAQEKSKTKRGRK